MKPTDRDDGLSQSVPAISIDAVSKSFGAIHAVSGVSMSVLRGTVHALVGANGAGKSTMMSILAGRIRPDSGEMRMDGRPVSFDTPRSARKAGICSIYQELTIVPGLSARANVFLGQEVSAYGWLAEAEMDRAYHALCRRLGVTIPARAAARNLSLADQQALEIMRGLASRSHVMLFDEPTTALAPAEREALFNVMDGLRQDGVTILLVSHNLEEVLAISDTITVFRDGSLVDTRPCGAWSKKSLVHAMIGREVAEADVVHRPRPANDEAIALSVRDVVVPGAIEGVSFEIRRGEILGIGGLVGSGRTSLLRALAGLEARSNGSMTIGSEPVFWPRTPRQAIDHGIALVPEDRKMQGLVGLLPAIDNLSLADLSRASRFGFIRNWERDTAAQRIASAFGFDPKRLAAPVRTLSGGNQQKVLLARWGYRVPGILLIDEPTRGIDIGAKDEILATIRRLAGQGLSIILVSSEIEEIVACSDRVAVLSSGRIVRTFAADREFAVSDIMSAAFGEWDE